MCNPEERGKKIPYMNFEDYLERAITEGRVEFAPPTDEEQSQMDAISAAFEAFDRGEISRIRLLRNGDIELDRVEKDGQGEE